MSQLAAAFERPPPATRPRPGLASCRTGAESAANPELLTGQLRRRRGDDVGGVPVQGMEMTNDLAQRTN